MDIFSDPVLLARVQFALTAAYHFFFVPLTIGLGLILALSLIHICVHETLPGGACAGGA